MLSHHAALLVDTNVLEESANSIFRVQASRVQLESCKEGRKVNERWQGDGSQSGQMQMQHRKCDNANSPYDIQKNYITGGKWVERKYEST